MYLRHFGLSAKPFDLTDDPDYYYPVPHEIASISLLYAIEQREGLAMLTGEPGTGKTTLLKRLLKGFDSHYQGVLLTDTAAVGGSLLAQFAHALGVKAHPEEVPIALRDALDRHLDRGRSVVLMVDEAQTMTRRQLAEVHFLSNLGRPERPEGRGSRERKLVQVFLVGQPLLEKKIAEPRLRALSQRVVVRTAIEPLGVEQMASYVDFRLRVAGRSRDAIFAPEAVARVHERTHGVTRLVNLVCERALVVAYADGRERVDCPTVEAAVADLSFRNELTVSATRSQDSTLERSERRVSPEGIGRLEKKLDWLIEELSRAGAIRGLRASDGSRNGVRVTSFPLRIDSLR